MKTTKNNKNNRVGKSAFTLVELLVVISIIALLMGILMPALQRVREQAKGLMCSTRLKDLGVCFNMYVNDNENSLPTNMQFEFDARTMEYILTSDGQKIYARWPNKLAPYYPEAEDNYDAGGSAELFTYEMFKCPTQKKYATEGGRGTYAYNIYFTGPDGPNSGMGWRKIFSIKTPANLPILADADGGKYMNLPNQPEEATGNWGGLFMQTKYPHPRAFQYGFMGGKPTSGRGGKNWDQGGVAPNHTGKCGFLFADFHVEQRDVCKDKQWPWNDHKGTAFHPRRNTKAKPF